MFKGKKIGVVIPAAGSGSRMVSDRPKQFLEIGGKPIILRTLQLFDSSSDIDEIVLVAGSDTIPQLKLMVDSGHLSKVRAIIPGGERRQDSVWNGLQSMKENKIDIVLVHDAVRSFVTHQMIHSVLHAADEAGSAIVAVQAKETIKLSDGSGSIRSTPQREHVWVAQTPQAFRFSILYSAYERAYENNLYSTDDASLAEQAGFSVKIIEGTYDNIKITTPEDLELAELIINRQNLR